MTPLEAKFGTGMAQWGKLLETVTWSLETAVRSPKAAISNVA